MGHICKALNNGMIFKKLAVFWFSLLGYAAAIVTIELVAKSVDSFAISATAKLSYVFVLFWLQANINDAIWWVNPELHPEHEFSSKEGSLKKLWRGGKYSGGLCIGVYFFIEYVIGIIVASGNA